MTRSQKSNISTLYINIFNGTLRYLTFWGSRQGSYLVQTWTQPEKTKIKPKTFNSKGSIKSQKLTYFYLKKILIKYCLSTVGVKYISSCMFGLQGFLSFLKLDVGISIFYIKTYSRVSYYGLYTVYRLERRKINLRWRWNEKERLANNWWLGWKVWGRIVLTSRNLMHIFCPSVVSWVEIPQSRGRIRTSLVYRIRGRRRSV